ncbi:MAG TPA: DUF3467 domain-containing protein [Candidatus Paceibacterota bacterium]
MEQNKHQVQINASPEELKGRYSNVMQIQHTKEEFVLDFFNILQASGALVSRVILSPGHLKRMLDALQENLKRYEENFGKIKPAEEPSKKIGF